MDEEKRPNLNVKTIQLPIAPNLNFALLSLPMESSPELLEEVQWAKSVSNGCKS